jgi:hypothetical protein
MAYFNPPSPTQRELDAAMARAIRDVKRDKSLIHRLAGLFTAAIREKRRQRTKHPGDRDGS